MVGGETYGRLEMFLFCLWGEIDDGVTELTELRGWLMLSSRFDCFVNSCIPLA